MMSPAEVERQSEKIMRAPLVVRDREYLFSEDVNVDEAGAEDPNLGVMAKFSSLIEVLRLVEVMISSTVSGRSSLCLPSVSTWMLRGHAARTWLVFTFCSVYSTWLVCIHFVECFSPSS